MSSIEEKIKKDLEKTGFPTEIKARRVLKKRQWFVQSQYPFLDKLNNKLRSLDFRAVMSRIMRVENDKIYVIQCQLYIECKKSAEKCWVFYVEDMSSQLMKLMWTIEMYDRSATKSTFTQEDKNKARLNKVRSHNSENVTKVAFTHQIAFGGGDDFYEAENQVLKCIKYSYGIQSSKTVTDIIYPVILFDGKMFECDLVGSELKISPIEYVQYLSNGIPEEPTPVLIDVVTLDYFPKYLELVEKELNEFKPDKDTRAPP